MSPCLIIPTLPTLKIIFLTLNLKQMKSIMIFFNKLLSFMNNIEKKEKEKRKKEKKKRKKEKTNLTFL
jgi:hypothetical protein